MRNQRALRAGIAGLAIGCGVAVWMVGHVAAQFGPAAPAPANPGSPVAPVPVNPVVGQQQLGGPQLGQGGQQLGQPVVSEADMELRKLFPLKSFAKRLDYEKAGRESQAKEDPSPRMTEETRKRLAALEDAMEMKRLSGRSQKMRQLYADPIPHLGNAPGTGMFGGMLGGMLGGSFTPSGGSFGQFGASPLTRKELELPSAAPLSFAAVRYGDSGKPSSQASGAPGPNMLTGLHESGLLDFLDPAGFGYIEDREHVAGFEPHQFRTTPELAGVNERWVVIRLELVSMLKHKEAVAYVTDVLPNVTDFGNASTRPLNMLEGKALKALREGDDLTTESSGDRIRMVGSLRATNQCLECHQVKRGDLLGAFSWELQRQATREGK